MTQQAALSEIADIGSAQADLDPSTDRYAKRFTGPAGEWMLGRQTAALRSFMPDGPVSVLDVGGGHGQVARPLLADGHEVTVLASTEQALGQVRDIVDPRLKTEFGSLTEVPFGDQSFDIVTSFRIMAHIGEWNALLAEMMRVARRAIIIDFPIPGGVNALEPLLFGLKKKLEGDTRKFATMTRPDVEAALRGGGFARTRHVGQFVLPMVVHRKLKRPGISAALEKMCGGLAPRIGTPVVLCAQRDAE
ncbi:MAG: class I SAM-dependent methyltransferase [Pseudomonadota bacterium]